MERSAVSTSLKIGKLPDTTPVKLNLTIDPELHSDLNRYADVYARAYGEKASIEALAPSMLRAFIASDSGFKKAIKSDRSTITTQQQ